MSKTIVQQLAEYTKATCFDQLPTEVVTECKRIVLDSIGCALAGIDLQKGRAGRDFAKVMGAGVTDASIMGDSVRVSIPAAAFANAELINTMDMDVITVPGHVAPAVLSSVMAVGESLDSSGKAVIEAVALGHDMSNRLGRATDNLRDTKDGKPNTPFVFGYTSPIFGAAAAIAKLKAYPVEVIANAIGIAGCISPVNSMMSWIEHAPATTIKYTLKGALAVQAVTAAYMAEFGHRGDLQVLDDREYGYARFIGTSKWEPEHIIHKLGSEWRFPAETSYKPYPHCRVPHGLIDCLWKILEEQNIMPEEIDGIKIFVEGIAAERPVWLNATIDDVHDAQFSLHHGIAVAAHRVPAGKAWLDPALIHSRSVMDLMKKVTSDKHPDFVKLLNQQGASRPARIEVVARGTTYVGEKRFPKGSPSPEPDTFMTNEELIAKFRHNAEGVVSTANIDSLVEAVMNLEEIANFRHIMRLTSSALVCRQDQH